ncbi:NMDA receptor synaptonuclear signaling and neuronal migration factor-like [Salvelinus fontinalis]|uniref:NMDA receptor synaptonuclear signaling and neuronal migration factor-like n=1 Tax=Salvelinus fontinalis TaxID=8038 RepID=UPI0024850AED|nr:NMDA receptor synaptonuclear signaling and neuronal migration factor-like [Salvelinus fontinalis]
MGTAVSKRKTLRNDAISSVTAKVRAARAFGDYLSHTHPENRAGSDHLLSDTFIGQDTDSPDLSRFHNNLQPQNQPQAHSLQSQPSTLHSQPSSLQPQPSTLQPDSLQPTGPSKRRLSAGLSVERSFSFEEQQPPPRSTGGSLTGLKPAAQRVYTITREGGMLGGRGSEESLELEVLKQPPSPPPSSNQPSYSNPQPPGSKYQRGGGGGNHHRGNHNHGPQNHRSQSQPLQSSGSAHNIRDWGVRRGGSREDCTPESVTCIRAPCQSQRSLDLETSPQDGGKQRKKLERMYSEDRDRDRDRQGSAEEREDNPNSWFPKENMFSFQTATTTMQAISAFRCIAERKRRKREQEATSTITETERNFRKHLRMVGSRRMKAQSEFPTYADRRAKSFNRSWSDPTPVKPDSLHGSRDNGDLQSSSGALDEGSQEDADWEEERELERAACEGEDFIPPKIILISSKVPKAEYVPNIIRRDDPSVIPILYDHEHATFDDIIEEIEKKLTAYRKGCKIWNMLIFCQGGPGHLYLLKNKVATFAKVEKEEDMIQFWKKLSRFMSKLNPEANLIHIMGCYVLGSANGEKLIQNLKQLMRPHAIEFKSPLELSAQGKEMIEMYFDFRLFRLWKTRQHSKLLDYDNLL